MGEREDVFFRSTLRASPSNTRQRADGPLETLQIKEHATRVSGRLGSKGAVAERRLWRIKRSAGPASKGAQAQKGVRDHCELWGGAAPLHRTPYPVPRSYYRATAHDESVCFHRRTVF